MLFLHPQVRVSVLDLGLLTQGHFANKSKDPSGPSIVQSLGLELRSKPCPARYRQHSLTLADEFPQLDAMLQRISENTETPII